MVSGQYHVTSASDQPPAQSQLAAIYWSRSSIMMIGQLKNDSDNLYPCQHDKTKHEMIEVLK